MLWLGAAAAAAMAVGATYGLTTWVRDLTPSEAADEAANGTIVLFDIRTPTEWRETGIGQHAVALSMKQPDFMDALGRRVDGDFSRPIAIICSGGVRSRFVVLKLAAAGYSNVYDVPEGMLGSSAGPGWVAQRLAIRRYPDAINTEGRAYP